MSSVAVQVDGLWKNFRLYKERNQYIKAALLRGRRARYEDFWAVQDVSFEVQFGSTLGIIGSNGSGKSTLLKCLARILYPNKGRVLTHGRIGALLELGAGFHYDLSGRENVFLNGAILGMSKRDLTHKFDEIVEFAGLERFIDTPVKNYSSGMVVRLGFAIAANVEPDILLIDEVLSVGDQTFQRRSIERIDQFRKDGRTIIVVSHATSQLQELCREVLWLEKGKLRELGPANVVLNNYVETSYGIQTSPPSVGKRHWGSGGARIVSLEVTDFKDNPVEVVHTGDQIKISLQIDARRTISSPIVTIRISTGSGIVLWEMSSRQYDILIQELFGTSSLEIVIPSVNLLTGQYFISASLADGSSAAEVDHLEDGYTLQVHQKQPNSSGIVPMSASWSLA
jgi:ABC-2 type transport system ATP-binding protein